jgi:hypothetical protein
LVNDVDSTSPHIIDIFPTSPPLHLHTNLPSSEKLELDPFTLEFEPVDILAPLGGPPTWHDAATEISIEELFEVPPWPITPVQSSSDDEMAEDLVVNRPLPLFIVRVEFFG